MSQVQAPAAAQRIDGRGKYLIPGLADMHVHWVKPDSLLLLRYLALGLTTIRDVHAGVSNSPALQAKRAVASGALLGPRIYTAGDVVDWKPLAERSEEEILVRQWLGGDIASQGFSYQALADSIAAVKRAGHDFLKQYAWPSPVYDSVTAMTRRVGLRVVGHVPLWHPPDGQWNTLADWEQRAPAVPGTFLERVLHDRWASIEHLTGYLGYLIAGVPEQVLYSSRGETYEGWFEQVLDTAAWMQPGFQWDTTAKLRRIAAATMEAGVWNVPTLTVLDEASAMLGDQNGSREKFYLRLLDMECQIIRGLQAAGAGLLAGNDHNAPDRSGNEVVALAKHSCLTPYQALATATRNVAVFLGTLDSTGTVTVGKRADLVLLDGNPLADIQAVAAPAGVVIGGRWLTREDLAARIKAADGP